MPIVAIGAGPILGAAVARRFGRGGMAVGLISRDAAKLEGWRHHTERRDFQARLGID